MFRSLKVFAFFLISAFLLSAGGYIALHIVLGLAKPLHSSDPKTFTIITHTWLATDA